jgi:hypothetical protein
MQQTDCRYHCCLIEEGHFVIGSEIWFRLDFNAWLVYLLIEHVEANDVASVLPCFQQLIHLWLFLKDIHRYELKLIL